MASSGTTLVRGVCPVRHVMDMSKLVRILLAACYHTKPYVCEDSDQLLEFVRATARAKKSDVVIPEPPPELEVRPGDIMEGALDRYGQVFGQVDKHHLVLGNFRFEEIKAAGQAQLEQVPGQGAEPLGANFRQGAPRTNF